MQKLGFPYTLLLVFILAFVACKKDNPIPIDEAEFPDIPLSFYPYISGSYWVYEWYKIDSLNNETFLGFRDSVYVAGDSTINGNLYQIVRGSYFGGGSFEDLLRDSSSYLVNENGLILFSESNYTDTLRFKNDTMLNIYFTWRMEDIGQSVTVPAGTFTTLNYKQTARRLNGNFSCGNNIRTEDKQYASGYGLIRETFWFFNDPNCEHFERRLVSYRINLQL